jgi:hypothetical protein
VTVAGSPPPVDPGATVGVLDEIERLSARNREQRDPDVERRLVELRHEAFATLDRTPGRESWPPALADPYPDVQGEPPSAELAELTPELVGGAIQHHGCLFVRGLLTPAQVDTIVDDLRHTFDARDRFLDGADETETAPWFVPFAAGAEKANRFGRRSYIRSVDSPRSVFDVFEVFAAAGLPGLVQGYLGERPVMAANKFALRCVTGDRPGGDFHQDGSFLGEGIRTVNVWLSLSECGGDNTERPGLDILPRRTGHLLDTGTEGAMFDWTVSSTVVEREAAGLPILRPTFQPGDALLFDELLVHRTGMSEGMADHRYAIESWFFAGSHYPPEHTAVVV